MAALGPVEAHPLVLTVRANLRLVTNGTHVPRGKCEKNRSPGPPYLYGGPCHARHTSAHLLKWWLIRPLTSVNAGQPERLRYWQIVVRGGVEPPTFRFQKVCPALGHRPGTSHSAQLKRIRPRNWADLPILAVVPTCAGEYRFVRVTRVLGTSHSRTCVAFVLARKPGTARDIRPRSRLTPVPAADGGSWLQRGALADASAPIGLQTAPVTLRLQASLRAAKRNTCLASRNHAERRLFAYAPGVSAPRSGRAEQPVRKIASLNQSSPDRETKAITHGISTQHAPAGTQNLGSCGDPAITSSTDSCAMKAVHELRGPLRDDH
jgi:hypothetical protein